MSAAGSAWRSPFTSSAGRWSSAVPAISSAGARPTQVVLPAWLSPGALAITHTALADGWFSFTLDLHHPRFGALMRQTAVFREADL